VGLHVSIRVFSVYPKGNDKANGEGHLSLYIRIVDKLAAGTFINATFRFLIYDQIQDNYLLIQGQAPISFQIMSLRHYNIILCSVYISIKNLVELWL